MKSLVIILALFAAGVPMRADPPLGKPADNKIYAQQLVDELARDNADVILIGFHVIAPGAKQEAMLACTHPLIGEVDDAGDLAAVAGQLTVLSVSQTDSAKYKVYLPLKDAQGHSIGLMTLNFKNEAGNDDTHYCARALALRNAVAKKIPSLAALVSPARG